MRFSSLGLLLSSLSATNADCAITDETVAEIIPGYSKMTFTGYGEVLQSRFSGAGLGNKVIFKNYGAAPIVTTNDVGLDVEAGESCVVTPEGEGPSAAAAMVGISSYLLGASPFITAASVMMSSIPYSVAATADCETPSITVEIYTDVDALIHKEFSPEVCPPESLYWKHHPTVHGGYEGCVGEKYLLPCPQDAQGASDNGLYSMTPINWNATSGECVKTGYTFADRTFWILWGDPLDKNELLKRTGFNPVVKIPMIRGPYPSYRHGTDETVELYDDASTAKAYAKDFLVYLGAMPASERDDWFVSMTEGAENGISVLWAAMALEIARTTCNRNIYVLMEAPAYGYNNNEIASWVNMRASSFYNSTECSCFPDECKSPAVTVTNVGFFPPKIPSRDGDDGVSYLATSASPNSPWMESMVFPENPSGVVKTPQLPNVNRRVCDGVYVWPMYFYYNDFEVPLDMRPECAGWSYAMTKGYSASARTGFITYSKELTGFSTAVANVMGTVNTIGNGLFSQWSWMGQMQLQQMMMSRPLSDPTSWVGAYSSIMKEKWDVINEAFADCPAVELTNYGKGAYAFFTYKDSYVGLQDSMISSFFMDVLGVMATTYYWGFRGADPSEFYGPTHTVYDFTRMQLYRDLNVYIEVARRASVVCSDTSASVDGYLSIDDWKAAAEGTKRGRHLSEAVPHLSNKQMRRLSSNMEMRAEYKRKTEACAPHYTTSCLFKEIGQRFEDEIHN